MTTPYCGYEYHDAEGSRTTVTITGTTLLQSDTINFHAITLNQARYRGKLFQLPAILK